MSQSEYAVACIAAPIRDESGVCAATISVVLSERQAQARAEELAAALQDAALRVELALGRPAAA
jgi:DNA-binding IclR family transcriptional regulator